jgi:hypothetical protein
VRVFFLPSRFLPDCVLPSLAKWPFGFRRRIFSKTMRGKTNKNSKN